VAEKNTPLNNFNASLSSSSSLTCSQCGGHKFLYRLATHKLLTAKTITVFCADISCRWVVGVTSATEPYLSLARKCEAEVAAMEVELGRREVERAERAGQVEKEKEKARNGPASIIVPPPSVAIAKQPTPALATNQLSLF
jgi:hypothetical protein